MLRRVARALCVGLFATGVLLFLWLPLSFFVQISMVWGPNALNTESGMLLLIHHDNHNALSLFFSDVPSPRGDLRTTGIRRVRSSTGWRELLIPNSRYSPSLRGRFVVIPLWLLAVVCLAWPVTSFIDARRRRRSRGFEVEATGGSADGEGGQQLAPESQGALTSALTASACGLGTSAGCTTCDRKPLACG